MASVDKFEPKILAFLCNWCAYAGADLAGVSRIQYPPNIRAIRVMCSGRVDPVFMLEALKRGADGVFIGACHPGDCHYQTGNYKTIRRVILLRKLLEQFGVNGKRLRLEFISASEGKKFASAVEDFVKELRELGPFKK
ncbi:MAG: hydrogenase iron-sulfur subunit [Candidatus Thermoplasmatota archaeon]|nr:hydrogenase iron-sulfur subunit [Candidatus Thermoplasmatota archaeon]